MELNRKPIIVDSSEVGSRLAALGWTTSELNEVVDAAVSGRNSVTANDVPNAAGWYSWAWGSRRLRELGVMKNLSRDDNDSVPGVRDDARGIKFVMANMDAGTGDPNEIPKNISERGPATSRAISTNDENWSQLLIESQNIVAFKDFVAAPNDPSGLVLWYLCVFAEGDTVRAELSCPNSCTRGFISGYSQRIIFRGFGDGSDDLVRRKDNGGDDEFKIEVFRKTS